MKIFAAIAALVLCFFALTPKAGPPISIADTSWPNTSSSSLLGDLVAYWRMDEGSGTRVDATGRGNDLSESSAPVPSSTGIITNSVNSTNSKYLSRADNADLSITGTSYTIALWFKVIDFNTEMGMVAKYSDVPNEKEFYLRRLNTGTPSYQYLHITNSPTGTGNEIQQAISGEVTNVWHHIVIRYSQGVTNQMMLRIDDSDSLCVTNAVIIISNPGTSTATFQIGTYSLINTLFFNGYIDEVGLWKRPLTMAEITLLYNGGAGRTYPF